MSRRARIVAVIVAPAALLVWWAIDPLSDLIDRWLGRPARAVDDEEDDAMNVVQGFDRG